MPATQILRNTIRADSDVRVKTDFVSSSPFWLTSSRVVLSNGQNIAISSATDGLGNPVPTKMTSSRCFPSLPDVFLHDESVAETNDDEPQEIIVARAEARARARQRRNGSRLLRGTDRQFAEALHREADSLHYKGDYETALVLYHRAASVCPRDSSHGVAARRTAAAINALSHPSKALNGFISKVKNGAQQSAMVCPESAALRASRILNESSDPVSVVPQILNFFDRRADFWRMPDYRVPPPPRRNPTGAGRSTISPTTRIRKMESMLNAGNPVATLQMGHEILRTLSYDITNQSPALNGHVASTHRLLALAYVALGRHDRATNSASKMTRAALTVNVPLLITEALITLGRVHLTFGHLKAAAQAWEGLVQFVSEPIPRAWLFHEIGRCHLENGDHDKALELASKCLDTAEAADSEKWTFHGRLLLGQTLAQMGRFSEAVDTLRNLTLAGEGAGDARTVAYVRDLTERLTRASKSEIRRPKVEEEADEFCSESAARSGSDSSSRSDEDYGEEAKLVIRRRCSSIATTAESLCSVKSSLSLDAESSKIVLEDGEHSEVKIADPGAPGEQESSIPTASSDGHQGSHESIRTGRTYGISSPLFRRSINISDSEEAVSTILDPQLR